MFSAVSRVFVTIVLVFLLGCKEMDSRLFSLQEQEVTGIKFNNTLYESETLNILSYAYFYNGGGVAIGDINNDGLNDILFTGNMVRNRLYLNKGNFKFEDITEQSTIADQQGWCTGATMVDINGDDLLDIYICRSADSDPRRRRNLLYINEGNSKFSERAAEYGLADEGFSTQASFFDYDKDDDLDCFIVNHSLQEFTGMLQQGADLRKPQDIHFTNKLYRNDNGVFKEVSKDAGINTGNAGYGLGLAISDFNLDGWMDVYVSNDFNEPDYLFINQQDGSFKEQLSQRMDQVSLYSMGADAADYNNDGNIDLVTLDMLPEDNLTQKMHSGPENFDKFQHLFSKGLFYQYSRNMLQVNNGDGTFSELGQLAGISNTDWSWAALLSDFDNDGNKDLFVTNGYVKDYTDMDFVAYSMDRAVKARSGLQVDAFNEYLGKMPDNAIPNYMFQNTGQGQFRNVTLDWGLNQMTVSSGAAYADLDNDGDLDIVVNNTNSFAGIYKNNNEKVSDNNFLKIKLKGDVKNRKGIGTKVKVYCKGQQYYQELIPVRGFQSSADQTLNFGIGKNTIIDSISLIWPNDREQKLYGIQSNNTITVKVEDAKTLYSFTSINTKPYFKADSLIQLRHVENNFNDFTRQTLLPHYFSRQGPCMAVADVNKDGLEDVFMGGAKDLPSRLFLQLPDGTMKESKQSDFLNHTAHEDVAAEFFDADKDGDVDLYVASGGYEFNENDLLLQDRLYINDGKGKFVQKTNALPRMLYSKGCVKAGDIDKDGDLDLFVGGRVVPGKYPVPPPSTLLINNGNGTFMDGTIRFAPATADMGMVSDASWVDINKDGYTDLMAVGEWMPIKVFMNRNGKLEDESAKYVPFNSKGWWNKIYTDDMDGDGDPDFIVGNCGLNTQFKSSEKEPITLYFKDFDRNGSVDPVLCYFINGVSYPAASKDDISEQLPFLKKSFLTYKEYANATINDLFTKEQLQDAKVLKAEMMETVYLENNHTALSKHLLPIEAQSAPVHAIISLDVNGDNKKDLLLAGNNSWTRIRFGGYRANHGVLLTSDGTGKFRYVPQNRSGLRLRGNVRSLLVVKGKKKKQVIVGFNNATAMSLSLNK